MKRLLYGKEMKDFRTALVKTVVHQLQSKIMSISNFVLRRNKGTFTKQNVICSNNNHIQTDSLDV